ncbi:hypothetical protein CR513_40744, partial [Mucuna pruriens]
MKDAIHLNAMEATSTQLVVDEFTKSKQSVDILNARVMAIGYMKQVGIDFISTLSPAAVQIKLLFIHSRSCLPLWNYLPMWMINIHSKFKPCSQQSCSAQITAIVRAKYYWEPKIYTFFVLSMPINSTKNKVLRSSVETEYRTRAGITRDILTLLQNLLKDFAIPPTNNIIILMFSDNQVAILIASNPSFRESSKHILIITL